MGYVEPSIGGVLDAGNVGAVISARRRRNSAMAAALADDATTAARLAVRSGVGCSLNVSRRRDLQLLR
eukprot:4064312-Prymnesium_polylepis.1